VLAPIDTATLAGQRDRALLLGFAAALRRSELVALKHHPLGKRRDRRRKVAVGALKPRVLFRPGHRSQQFLYFRPLPHGHGSLRPGSVRRC